MQNDKLILTLLAIGSLCLLGISFYFLSYPDRNTPFTEQSSEQSLSNFDFAPPPANDESPTPTWVENDINIDNPINDNINNIDNIDNEINDVINDMSEASKITSEAEEASNSSSPTQTPAEFIEYYFSVLKSIPYEQTWAMQSTRFRANNTVEKHTKWWSKQVEDVYVDKVLAENEQQVTVRLRYQMKNGRKVCSIDTFDVIESDTGWLIDKQKYRNCR